MSQPVDPKLGSPSAEGQELSLSFPFPHANEEEVLRILRQIAEALQTFHTRGQLYGSLEVEKFVRAEPTGAWTLLPPAATVDFPRFASDAPWYPALASHGIATLPSAIPAAQALLDQLAPPLKAGTIDCYALGSLACRLFANCSVADYLRSPKALARVPAYARPFIDAALGFDRTQRADSIAPLIESLEASLQSLAGAPTATTLDRAADERSEKKNVTSAAEADIPFTTLGHFRLVRRVGHGGMGDVYEGYDDSLKRRVALKLLPAELGRQESFVQRFYSEAASVAKIVHPNIVQIFFIGHDRGHHYFAMEFVDGSSLAEHLVGQRSLPVPAAIGIVQQVLKGLSAAHAKGLVHRDVKPGNILIEDATERCLLADFGLVKSVSEESGPTHSGTVLGTMDYVSPEQGRGQPVDFRSDLYSLGVVLYEMLCGRLPFEADSPTGMIFQHVYERPEPLHTQAPLVPLEVSAIVAKMMAKSPAQRYSSAESVLADLAAFSHGVPLPSGADQALLRDADTFARTARETLATQPASVIVRAPSFEDLDSDLEILERSPATGWGKWLQRWHDWLEARSPAIAERLQHTQLQIDRALQKMEKHRDQLIMLDRDARAILKQLKQQVVAVEQSNSAGTNGAGDSLLVQLQRAAAEQEQQVDEIHARLSKINTQLAQARSERDVLVARLRAAEARRRMHTDGKSTGVLRWKIIAIAGTIAFLGLAWRLYWPPSNTAASARSVADASRSTEPHGRQWPVSEQAETIIPLDANVKAIALRTSNYNGRPSYTLLASLEDDSVVKFLYRKELDRVHQWRFPAAPVDVRAVALSPAGTWAAFALGDHSIRIFKMASESADEYRRLEGHLAPASALVFSDDDSTLVSASNDQTLRFWDLQSGSEQQRFEIPQVSSPMLAANHALSRFLLGGRQRGGRMPARVWDLVGERQAAAFPLDTAVSSVALSRDAETAYAFAAGRIYAWKAISGEKLREFGAPSTIGAIATPAQRAVTLADGQLQLWDTESGQRIDASTVAIQPNAQTQLLLADSGEAAFATTSDKRLHILSLPAAPPPDGLLHTFSETSAIHALDISSDGVWAAGGGDGKIFVWNLILPSASYTFDTSSAVTAVRFSPHLDYLAFGTGQKDSQTNYVGIREITNDTTQRFFTRKEDWRKLTGFREPLTGLAWDSHGERVFASSKDGSLKIWEPSGDTVQARLQLPEPIQDFINFGDQQTSLLITGLHNLTAWKWGSPETSADFSAVEASVLAVSAPGSDWIAVADKQGQITVIDSLSRRPVASMAIEADPVTALAFIPFTNRLAAGHSSGLMSVWDFKASRQIRRFPGRGNAVTAIAVTPSGRYAVAASLSGTVNVWQLP